MKEITEMSLSEISTLLAEKRISATETVKACLDRIHKTEYLNNFISLTEDRALSAAKKADELIFRGENKSALCGVPIAVKDNIAVRGVATTCGSRLFSSCVAERDAKCIERLDGCGAAIVGKTNMDELAMGSTDESSAFGIVRNFLDVSRVPGGSSGGSANCVAAMQVFGALGTDTGGSIRQPAAYCGVVGLKPTFSSASEYRDGLKAFAPSLDVIGTLTRSADDALLLFDALCGKNTPVTYLSGEIQDAIFGIADEFSDSPYMDDGVKNLFDNAVKELEKAGAKIKRVSIPTFRSALSAYHILSSAEAAERLVQVMGGTAGFEKLGDEVKRRIFTGLYVSTGDNYDEIYVKAARVRATVKNEYEEALRGVDAIVCPTAPTVAALIGETVDPIKNHSNDYFLAPVSLAGLPAVSVPCGKTPGGLPVGMQIIGKPFAEKFILNVGKCVMSRT